MPRLEPPCTEVWLSYLDALEEYRSEGPADDPPAGLLGDPGLFARYVADVRAGAQRGRPRPPGHVPYTMLWWIEGSEYLGRLSIRHELTPALESVGGHVSYDVRPTARRRGHATAMLAAALPIAASLGLPRVLMTCEASNVASRLVIERNGGVPSEPREGSLRYWVPTR